MADDVRGEAKTFEALMRNRAAVDTARRAELDVMDREIMQSAGRLVGLAAGDGTDEPDEPPVEPPVDGGGDGSDGSDGGGLDDSDFAEIPASADPTDYINARPTTDRFLIADRVFEGGDAALFLYRLAARRSGAIPHVRVRGCTLADGNYGLHARQDNQQPIVLEIVGCDVLNNTGTRNGSGVLFYCDVDGSRASVRRSVFRGNGGLHGEPDRKHAMYWSGTLRDVVIEDVVCSDNAGSSCKIQRAGEVVVRRMVCGGSGQGLTIGDTGRTDWGAPDADGERVRPPEGYRRGAVTIEDVIASGLIDLPDRDLGNLLTAFNADVEFRGLVALGHHRDTRVSSAVPDVVWGENRMATPASIVGRVLVSDGYDDRFRDEMRGAGAGWGLGGYEVHVRESMRAVDVDRVAREVLAGRIDRAEVFAVARGELGVEL